MKYPIKFVRLLAINFNKIKQHIEQPSDEYHDAIHSC